MSDGITILLLLNRCTPCAIRAYDSFNAMAGVSRKRTEARGSSEPYVLFSTENNE